MVIEKIIIPTCPVTKKNSQRIVTLKNGRKMVLPSKKYAEYQDIAGAFIPISSRICIDTPVNVKCVYYMSTKRRVDLVNLLEATCDMLVFYGVIDDDNSNIIVSHDGSRVLYDKQCPRVEIEISEAVI